ncbi:carbon-nitrogen hydrolase family protein [Bradyrhizobium sp. Arg237L]|uniref:carbon-nitrogen hydrolase family protein n=1 Tax=Bradyrhizobium sp. Arg237L TaxID=3003352 RepID=UPI00249DA943|nr:carbon-nitrogen hydrolase family protein [Bradyrhizobium sp. Arg237L]MDI4237136.1 carbon-nitrogen hydrolase family protein [Bradyrhizobium sp. Arg237L]
MTTEHIKVAAAHVAPVFLEPTATIEKAIRFIAQAAEEGASLIAFPESFVPGFPIWAAVHAPIRTHDAFAAFAAASIYADGPEVRRLQDAAQRHNIFVSIGFSERDPASVGGLWNSNLLIGDDGSILVHHRKLVPTFYEKLAWNPGDAHGLRVAQTRIGRIGALICGENTNPLARFALIAQGEQIHVASYPPVWPTRPPEEAGNYDNRSANRIRAAAHAFEAKCFVMVVGSLLDEAACESIANGDKDALSVLEATPTSESFFVDPTGAVFGGSTMAQGLVFAELDLRRCIEPKRFHDVAAGYNRFDLFGFHVRRHRLRPAHFADMEGEGAEIASRLDDRQVG